MFFIFFCELNQNLKKLVSCRLMFPFMMQIVVSAWGFKILRSSKEITEMHHKLGF